MRAVEHREDLQCCPECGATQMHEQFKDVPASRDSPLLPLPGPPGWRVAGSNPAPFHFSL